MKALWIFLLLSPTLLVASRPCKAQDGSDLSVISFSWSRYNLALNAEPKWGGNLPSRQEQIYDREKITMEKNYGDLIRSQELRKVERAATRSLSNQGDVFTYKVKVQNTGIKTIKNLYWEYQIIEAANSENLSRRQFFCGASIKINDSRVLQAFSLAAPRTSVISAKTLKTSKKRFEERAVINRIEYADGSFWQRENWDFPNPWAATLSTAKRDRREPVCRGL